MKINLNDKVRFRLTEVGARSLASNTYSTLNAAPGVPQEAQLWRLIAELGPHIYIGMPTVIEGNDIEVLPE